MTINNRNSFDIKPGLYSPGLGGWGSLGAVAPSAGVASVCVLVRNGTREVHWKTGIGASPAQIME